MKIISGKFKGKNFFMPQGLRATQNIVRKAVFDLLGHDLEGLSFLELFAGSGAVGLEAMSMGASRVVLVEKDYKNAAVIEQNLKLFGIDPLDGELTVQLFNTDAFVAIRQLERFKKKFDIVFLDPPYEAELAKKVLITLEGCDILHPNCFVVVQHVKREKMPPEEGRLKLEIQRKYGATYLSIYRIKESLG